ncbi:MAG: DUF3375 domain-containing protein [Aureliella sp.]
MSDSSYLASMRRDSLRSFFDASPTARLLRSDHAPLVVDFLHQTFKAGNSISIGQSELRTQLVSYQEELHAVEPEVMVGTAERYVAQWVEHGWLSRFLEASSVEPQYQLTRYAEEAIRFVESVLSRNTSLVGTESRLRLVIETLEDIVRGASADPERRLDYLREQRRMIDEEIAAIESGKSVQVYRPSQIRERFQTAIELLRALQADFRAVEERFQAITRDVHQQQSKGESTRGGILGFALDAEDLLKQQDEGVSFFAFVAFLFSPNQQAALRKTIDEVQQLAALSDQHDALSRMRTMVPALLAEADKVMRTTARLSSTLRRLLDAQATEQRIRLAAVLRDIRTAALKVKDELPNVRATISADAEIGNPFTRTFWKARAEFDNEEPAEHIIDLAKVGELAARFAKMQRLDLRRLRDAIREATLQGQNTTLAELVERLPNSQGVVELLGFMQIAHDDGHEIDASESDIIRIEKSDVSPGGLDVRVPRVVFSAKARTAGSRPR